MKLPDILYTIAATLQSQGANAIVVGGSVRDSFLGLPAKDYDVEVYGLTSMEHLEVLLAPYGSVNLVGKSFGVLKLSYEGVEYDFSFPRTESKTGRGHNDFAITVDGALTFKRAAKRRDFTINALGYDVKKGIFLDPFEGIKDLEAKQLRHIDDATFIEDPLRVYRAVQFCARFGFSLSSKTKQLCRKMVEEKMLEALPKERVYAEWKKLLLQSPHPSVGFELMREVGIVAHYFPPLNAIIGVPQPPQWHPEGDVWVHTMMALDIMASIVRSKEAETWSEKEKLKFLFAILCHDLGKATHTTIGGIAYATWLLRRTSSSESAFTPLPIHALGHEEAGVEPTRTLLYALTDEHDFITTVLPLVAHHLKPSQLYHGGAKDAAIRRLASKVNLEALVVVAKADFLGRTTEEALHGVFPAGVWLLQKAEALQVRKSPIKPLLQGRDLIALGLSPSPRFKEILESVYLLQEEGSIETKEDAMRYVELHFSN